MKKTVRIALLLSLTIAAACRFAADKKDAAVRFLAASVVGSVAELQSATPLEQSEFRNTEPVAPKKDADPAPRISTKKAVRSATATADSTVEIRRSTVRVIEIRTPAVTNSYTFCSSVREATSEAGASSKQIVVVVPMADTIGG